MLDVVAGGKGGVVAAPAMKAPAANARIRARSTARIRSGTGIPPPAFRCLGGGLLLGCHGRHSRGAQDAARPPCSLEHASVPGELEPVARGCGQGVELEGDVAGSVSGREIARIDGGRRLPLETAEPALHGLGDRVAKRSGPGVELDRGRGQEAAARQHLALVVGEPAVAERQQAGQTGLLDPPPVPQTSAPEALDRRLQRRQLQLLLAAEQAEDAALPHLHLAGQAADGEALEALDGGTMARGLR